MTAANPRKRLGRGLEALLGPVGVDQARDSGDLRQVAVSSIRPNPFQPRKAFDPEAIVELAESMRGSGLLQPVVLRPAGQGSFELIAGERRWRAAQQLGWRTIGAVVREVDDRTLLTLALVENLQRDALSPIDEANGYRRLVEDFDATQSEVAELVGRDRSTVANALRLLKLPANVQVMLHDGQLDPGHGRALLQVADAGAMESLAKRVISEGLSVRETEARARGGRSPSRRPRATKSGGKVSPELRRIEETLRRHLQTDVHVSARSNGAGRLTVSFYSNDDLARLLELILGERFAG